MKVALCLLLILVVSSSWAMNYTDVKCRQYPPPKNGVVICRQLVNVGASCNIVCDPGYDVVFLQAEQYICKVDGQWHVKPSTMRMPWPDCTKIEAGMPIP